MKKIIVTLALAIISVAGFAQSIGYLPSYNRSSTPQYQSQPQSSQSQQRYYSQPQQSSSEVVRTTAYYQDEDGLYKVPVRVEVTNRDIRIISQYTYRTSYEGSWETVYSGGYAQKCSHIGTNSALESQFMYKATVGMHTYYFDL